MGPRAKKVILQMINDQDLYLVPCMRPSGIKGCRIYRGNQVPVGTITYQTFDNIRGLLKKKGGRYTVNMSFIRQLHGRSEIKRKYKTNKAATAKVAE